MKYKVILDQDHANKRDDQIMILILKISNDFEDQDHAYLIMVDIYIDLKHAGRVQIVLSNYYH